MGASVVPTVINALTASLVTALPGVLVVNGQKVSDAVTEAVAVAWQDDNTPTAVIGQFTSEGYAVDPDREQFTIQCAVVEMTGDDTYLASRARAFDLLAAVRNTLGANPTLSGVVLSAMVGAYSLTETLTEDLTVITLSFGVDIDAYATI